MILKLDEIRSFVYCKSNKQWIWLAVDADTRQIVGVHLGDRSRDSAQCLWDSLPQIYRDHAPCYTDYWETYEPVIPSCQHYAVGKENGKTSYMERFNNTVRQRMGRLLRKNLSFSKKLSNHIGAIWMFVHHYDH